jgi:hypothetical protein
VADEVSPPTSRIRGRVQPANATTIASQARPRELRIIFTAGVTISIAKLTIYVNPLTCTFRSSACRERKVKVRSTRTTKMIEVPFISDGL